MKLGNFCLYMFRINSKITKIEKSSELQEGIPYK